MDDSMRTDRGTRLAQQVVRDLKYVKKWPHIEICRIEDITFVRGQPSKDSDTKEVILPVLASQQIDPATMHELFRKLSKDDTRLRSINLAIMASDSTIVYYRAHDGLSPPKHINSLTMHQVKQFAGLVSADITAKTTTMNDQQHLTFQRTMQDDDSDGSLSSETFMTEMCSDGIQPLGASIKKQDEIPYSEVLQHRRHQNIKAVTYRMRLERWAKRSLPLWMVRYKKKWFFGDIIAGITVGAVAVPQGIAYATIVGLPPIHGLYSSFIPLLIYAFMGTSKEIAIGPFSLVSLLAAEAVGQVCKVGDPLYLPYTLLLTFMVGAILILAGILRLGFLVNFMSNPVLEGFQCAAALVMAANQLLPLFGQPGKEGKTFYDILSNFYHDVSGMNYITLIIGLGMIVFLLMLKQVNKYIAKYKFTIPAPLVVVCIGILIGWAFSLGQRGVLLVGNIEGGLPPVYNALQQVRPFREQVDILRKLLMQSAVLALVTFMLTISVSKSYAEKRRYEVRSNQELIALGTSNLVGSFFGCFPTAGSMSRTSINVTGGAKTQLSGIVSAMVVFSVLMLLTGVLKFLPVGCLASIIIVSVIPMIQPHKFIEIWRTKPSDLLLCLVAFVCTLSFGIANGIILSILASIVGVIYSNSRPTIAVLGRLPGTNSFHSVNRFPHALVIPGMTIIRMDASLFFANVNFFRERLFLFRHRENTRCIILDFEGVNDMDYTAATVFKSIVRDIRQQKTLLLMANIKGPVRDVFQHSGLIPIIGTENILWEVKDAVQVGERWMADTGILAEELHPYEEEHFDWSDDERQPLVGYTPYVFENPENPHKSGVFASTVLL